MFETHLRRVCNRI